MNSFRNPDWQGPLTLGMWQICYRIDGERHLLIFRGGGREAPANPVREWGLAVMCGNARDGKAEQQVQSIPALAGTLRRCQLSGTEVFALNEGDIDFVVDRVREAFHQAPLPAGG